jgi:predicted metalloprotease with PDZ domain
VSYYNKGALVALCLDLRLRLDSDGRVSLDDVMRELWRRYGKPGEGAPERALENIAQEISGQDLAAYFDGMIRGTDELPLAELLAPFGIEATLRLPPSATERPGVSLGLRLAGGGSMPQVSHVLEGTAAQAAGLAAGDILVAIDGLRVEGAELERMLAAYSPGETVEVHAFRRDELLTFRMVLDARPADAWVLRARTDADEAMLSRRKAWLGT